MISAPSTPGEFNFFLCECGVEKEIASHAATLFDVLSPEERVHIMNLAEKAQKRKESIQTQYEQSVSGVLTRFDHNISLLARNYDTKFRINREEKSREKDKNELAKLEGKLSSTAQGS